MKPENYPGKRLKTSATWDTLLSLAVTSEAHILIEQEVYVMRITMDEFNTMKLGACENALYNRIAAKFRALLPGNMGEKLLEKFWGYTLRELSCNSLVNIMDCFVII